MSANMPVHFPRFLSDFLPYQQLHQNTTIGSDGDPDEGEYQLILKPEDALIATHQCREELITALQQKLCSEAEEEIGIEIKEIIYCGKCNPDALLKSDNVAIGIAASSSITQQRLDEFENITSVDLSIVELLQGLYHDAPMEDNGTSFHLRDIYTAHAMIHLLCNHQHLVGNIKIPRFSPKSMPQFDPSTFITPLPGTGDSMLRFQQIVQSRSDFPILDKNQGDKQLEVDEQKIDEIIVAAQNYLIHQHNVDPHVAKKWASRDALVCETKDLIFVRQPMSFFGRGGRECTALFRRIVRKDGIDVVLLPLLEMKDRTTRIFSRVFFSVAPDPICHKGENKLRQWHLGLPSAAFNCTRDTLEGFACQILHQR